MQRITLKISEFCEAAGICRTRAYEEIAAGRLRPVKCGRRTLIPASELQAWLQRLQKASARKHQPSARSKEQRLG